MHGDGTCAAAEMEETVMKHTRPVTRKPALSQISNFQVFKDFLVALVDQAIEYAFIKTS